MIQDLLKKLDMSGIKPSLYINNNEIFKTSTIGAFNLIYIFIVIASFFYFGIELFDRVKPEITLAQEHDDIPQDLIIDFNNYNIMIDIQDTNWQNYYNDSIYRIEAQYTRMYSNGSIFQDNVQLLPCTEDLFGDDNRQLYRSVQTKNNWCIDRNAVKNITLRGTFNNPEFFYLGFNVNSCKNDSSNIDNPCAPKK